MHVKLWTERVKILYEITCGQYKKPDSVYNDLFHFIACLGNEVNGEWQNSTTDETFMSNLELQKVDQDSESELEETHDDSPSANMVLHHIIRITSDKKFTERPQDTKPIPAADPLSMNGDIFDAESICEQVKIELVKYNISQEIFAKAVLGKSQGYLSEMLKHGESFFRPQDHTHYKGWLNFETMRQFLLKPEAERLRIYYHKGEELKMERMKRRHIEIVSEIFFFVVLVVILIKIIMSCQIQYNTQGGGGGNTPLYKLHIHCRPKGYGF